MYFFSFILLERHCSYFVIANLVFIIDDIYMMRLLLQFFHLSLLVLFLFTLMHMILISCMQCFTIRCHDEFCLKCFRNIGCQSLSCHELSSCKVFQEFVLG